LLWLRTEMEKLLTARPAAKRLERADLDLIVAFREEHEIGKLLKAVAERKLDEALSQLRALLASKESETLLLWCIGDLFRQALKSGSRPAYGRSSAPYGAGRSGWNRFASPWSAQELAPRTFQTYARPELLQALRLVRRADLGIKSSWKDSRILLEFLLWQVISGRGAESVPPLAGEMPALSTET